MTKTETALTGIATIKKYALGTQRTVSKNKTLFINNDIIQQGNSHYEFVDPAFELWFKKQYFNVGFAV